MVHDAVNPPSVVVAVMVAVPVAIPRTCPIEETVAMLLFVEDHETVLVVAVLGRTVEINVKVAVLGRVNVVRLSDTPVAAVETRTTRDADLFPSCVETVIIVDPFPTAVIRPVLDSVAIEGCKDLHETVLFVAFTGRTVAID
jgi:hypothetical protein